MILNIIYVYLLTEWCCQDIFPEKASTELVLKSEYFSRIEYIVLVPSQDHVLHIFGNLVKIVVFTHPKFIWP